MAPLAGEVAEQKSPSLDSNPQSSDERSDAMSIRMEALLVVVVETFASGANLLMTLATHGREPSSNPEHVATVATLAQVKSWADVVTQGFLLLAGQFATFGHALSNIMQPLWTQAASGPIRA